MSENIAPQIDQVSWGHIEVSGHGTFKDAKLYPGGAKEWDWRETGTHHVPGIQPADVQELIDNGAREIVLSRGMWLALQVCPETTQLLEKKQIKVHVLETKKAVLKFNELRKSVAVGGLFHSTC